MLDLVLAAVFSVDPTVSLVLVSPVTAPNGAFHRAVRIALQPERAGQDRAGQHPAVEAEIVCRGPAGMGPVSQRRFKRGPRTAEFSVEVKRYPHQGMGQRVGKSRPAIANSLRLLDLPATIQEGLERNEISEGHARALLGDRKNRQNPAFVDRQTDVFRQAINKGLSVRDVERLMGAPLLAPAAPVTAENVTPADWKALEDRLRSALSTRVRLQGTAGRGKIEIEFFSEEELDGLLQKLDPAVAPQESNRAATSRIQGLLSGRRTH